ncbi:hypothetical protein PanWU01x14_286800, partial [Parasponia andersonii]
SSVSDKARHGLFISRQRLGWMGASGLEAGSARIGFDGKSFGHVLKLRCLCEKEMEN